mmetsp:Transcript_42110/g.86019  ORF Transcript_42110/g.86019 Transcript_42110/m.86019 type:complete len:210 (-) Transcript_42110:327-956(-)
MPPRVLEVRLQVRQRPGQPFRLAPRWVVARPAQQRRVDCQLCHLAGGGAGRRSQDELGHTVRVVDGVFQGCAPPPTLAHEHGRSAACCLLHRLQHGADGSGNFLWIFARLCAWVGVKVRHHHVTPLLGKRERRVLPLPDQMLGHSVHHEHLDAVRIANLFRFDRPNGGIKLHNLNSDVSPQILWWGSINFRRWSYFSFYSSRFLLFLRG